MDAADTASRDVDTNGVDPTTLLHEAPADNSAPGTKLDLKENGDGLSAAGGGGVCGSRDNNVLADMTQNDPGH